VGFTVDASFAFQKLIMAYQYTYNVKPYQEKAKNAIIIVQRALDNAGYSEAACERAIINWDREVSGNLLYQLFVDMGLCKDPDAYWRYNNNNTQIASNPLHYLYNNGDLLMLRQFVDEHTSKLILLLEPRSTEDFTLFAKRVASLVLPKTCPMLRSTATLRTSTRPRRCPDRLLF
jgi:hypothetical protein